MRCHDDGYNYDLYCFLDPPHNWQSLIFYRLKEDGSESNGVTNEEVLEVLIHRLRRLNEKLPCKQNEIVITKLEECRFWLNKRTEDRLERKVEGTHKP